MAALNQSGRGTEIFATFPAPYFGSSLIGPLIDQIVGTAFLLMFVLALTDERNQPPNRTVAAAGYAGRLGRTATRRPPQCGQGDDPGAVAEAPSRK